MVQGGDKGIQSTLKYCGGSVCQRWQKTRKPQAIPFYGTTYAYNNYLPFNPWNRIGSKNSLPWRKKERKDLFTNLAYCIWKHFCRLWWWSKNHLSVRSGFRRKLPDVSKETREAIAKGAITDNRIPYLDGAGPVNVKYTTQFEVQDGKVQPGWKVVWCQFKSILRLKLMLCIQSAM